MSKPRPYALFDIRLARKRLLSPHLCRLTFCGADIADIRTCAPDQRVKLLFPHADGSPSRMPTDGSWLQVYQELSPDERPPRRTYTIRALRRDELDIDFVLHGEAGPASRWATHAVPGDPLQIAAPSAAFEGDPRGYEWRPPQGVEQVLLLADETALPAASGILEALAASANPPRVDAFLEVPACADCVGIAPFPGLACRWLAREETGLPHGAALVEVASTAALGEAAPAGVAGTALSDVDVDGGVLWELAEAESAQFYLWAAGEAGAIKAVRQVLLRDRGLDRSVASLMGYWRLGREMD